MEEIKAKAILEDMDLANPRLVSLPKQWHGKDMKDIPDHYAGILYNAYL